jgi:hypothetical protein
MEEDLIPGSSQKAPGFTFQQYSRFSSLGGNRDANVEIKNTGANTEKR